MRGRASLAFLRACSDFFAGLRASREEAGDARAGGQQQQPSTALRNSSAASGTARRCAILRLIKVVEANAKPPESTPRPPARQGSSFQSATARLPQCRKCAAAAGLGRGPKLERTAGENRMLLSRGGGQHPGRSRVRRVGQAGWPPSASDEKETAHLDEFFRLEPNDTSRLHETEGKGGVRYVNAT